jgi:hypothetical protein
MDGAELSFWVHARGGSMGKLSVGVSNSPNGPFYTAYTQLGETHLAANSPWIQIGIDLSSYLGQSLYASFTYTRLPFANPTYTGDLAIDLLEVTTCSNCPSPSNIFVFDPYCLQVLILLLLGSYNPQGMNLLDRECTKMLRM